MFLSETRTQTVVNGNVVEDSGFNVEYDGKHLNLGLIDGGEDPVYIKMNNISSKFWKINNIDIIPNDFNAYT